MNSPHVLDRFAPSPPTWHNGRILGHGSYGVVYYAVYAKPDANGVHQQIAVKTARLETASTLFKEYRVYQAFRGCPKIVRCYSEQITAEHSVMHYNLLLEYAPAGTLTDLIKKSGGQGLPECDVRAYARMILEGLRCMHAKGYVHCDLKPANILAFPNSEGGGGNIRTPYKLKLADFGLTKEPQEEVPMESWEGRFRGTPFYMSPESVALGMIGPVLDVWSLGCTVTQMVSGCMHPWPDSVDLGLDEFEYLLIYKRFTPAIPPSMSETGKDFLRRCLQRDHKKRWPAEKLLLHPYVDGLISDMPQTALAQCHQELSPPVFDLNLPPLVESNSL